MGQIQEEPVRTMLAMLGAVGGLLSGVWISSSFALLDTPADPMWAIVAAVVAVALALRRPPSGLVLVYAAIALVSIMGSHAVGSSWAIVSWLPFVLAVVELARLSPAFLLALTAVVLVREIPGLVVVKSGAQPGSFSGSPLFFLGFVGAIAVPVWFQGALTSSTVWYRRVLASSSVLVTALAAWAVFASSSRAALLGLGVALVAWVIGRLVVRVPSRSDIRSLVFAAATVAALVIPIDFGLAYAFGDGSPMVASSLSRSLGRTVHQIEVSSQVEGSSVGGIRVALWQQAARILTVQPLGHGIGSYQHVIHAYQADPMLWSGSPHSMWALAAVETGLPGVLSLAALVAMALLVSARRGSAAMPALVAGTVVMSIDVFGSMPVYGLVWWAAVGAALGPSHHVHRGRHAIHVVALIAILAVAVALAVRLAAPCGEDCDRIVQYGGLPRIAGTPLVMIGDDPHDPRWASWRDRYPYAFWLSADHVEAMAIENSEARMLLLRDHPFVSAQLYIDVADAFAPEPFAADVAACGLTRFFDGRRIYRDQRSSEAELARQRAELEERAGASGGSEEACVRAGIPSLPKGFMKD